VADIEAWRGGAQARVTADSRQHVATPILLRPIEYGARRGAAFDDKIHRARHQHRRHDCRQRQVPVAEVSGQVLYVQPPEIAYHGVVYVDHFGDSAFVARCRTVCQRNTGATLSPFNGFLFLQGIQTLALRVERHVENARKVAEFLRDHPAVAWVNYVGFPDNPLYPMAIDIWVPTFCSLLTFGVKGGYEAGGSASTPSVFSSGWSTWRRQIALVSSRIDHASPTHA